MAIPSKSAPLQIAMATPNRSDTLKLARKALSINIDRVDKR